MGNEKLISVIIPVYGVENYISQCLDSIINQSYKNLEIIVINDGTKDRSAEIAKEYAQKDKRVRVYDYENAGVSVARNLGLELAKGEYISFVDSDDWLHPDFYKILADALETNNADIAKCSVVITDTVKEIIKDFKKTKVRKAAIDLFFHQGLLWRVVWNALYKREIVMDIRYPAGVNFEDNYGSGMYIFKAKKVVELKDALYYYRYNTAGITKGVQKYPFDLLIVISRLRNDLFKLGFTDKRMDSLVAAEAFRLIRDKGDSRRYRIKAIDKEWYEYIKNNLSSRRRIRLYYLLHKMHIEII